VGILAALNELSRRRGTQRESASPVTPAVTEAVANRSVVPAYADVWTPSPDVGLDVSTNRVVLLAPRYNGGSVPVAEIPRCWCCTALYELELLLAYRGTDYAWLRPSCQCLEGTKYLSCCGKCEGHCHCHR